MYIVVQSIPNINVLGVCFDSKFTWSKHIANTINKANKALHVKRLIKNISPTLKFCSS